MKRLPWVIAFLLAAVHWTASGRDTSPNPSQDAGVTLGRWFCIGPFKDAEYGVFAREFDTVFAPEADVLARGDLAADLDRPYESFPVVGMASTLRPWTERRDWTDGYYHQLPSGPPPGRNEVMYLYRTITCTSPGEMKAWLVTLDAAKAWLNGRPVLNAPIRNGAGQRFLQVSMELPFHAGENRLLVKITKCFQKNGFSFAVDGLHPVHPILQPQEKSTLQTLGSLFQGGNHSDEVLKKVRDFRLEVEPLPTFDPPVLKMQEALDREAPTPGGEAYTTRLAPVRVLADKALAACQASTPDAPELLSRAAGAIDNFRTVSIREIGPIVYVRHPSFGRINAVNPYETPGASPAGIVVFDPANPDALSRIIYDDPDGSVFNMSLSYDASTLFFSAKRKGVSGGWHIYEIGVDGSNLKQISDGVCDDISPVELPSGEILFVSDRNGSVNVCQANQAGVLFVCNRDGGNLRRISANTLSDHGPSVMNDGRVMFTRWDYGVDKGVFQRHGVWTMNPDGTHLQLYFGNTVLDPNAFWQCMQVPGRPEVVSTFGGHHAGPYGVVGLLWDRLGQEAPRGEGFRFLTPECPTYFDGDFQNGYIDPFPLNENEFLVSYGGESDRKSRIYLLDNRGNKTRICDEAGALGCYNPIPLRPRRRPPVLAPQCKPEEFTKVDPVISGICPDDTKAGTLFLSDVYAGLQGQVERGEVKALQIMELVPKTRPHTGGYAYNISPLIGRGTFYVRRLIGTVPVEEDGSAHFVAPALRDISFNALDAEGRVLQKMGSTAQLMPGERSSCMGCHSYLKSPDAESRTMPLAGRRSPSEPQRPDWGTQGIIDYVLVVQPVWDKYCVECHSGAAPKGNLNLSGDKTRYFNMSYDMLIDRGFIHHIPQNGADQDLTTPRANGTLASSILKYLDTDHCGRLVPREDRQRVYTWIDANVPYYHTYLYTDGNVNGARDRWYDDLENGWFRAEFAPVFMRRCFDCHKREVEISDAWLGRVVVTVTSKVWSDITIMDQSLQIENAMPVFGPEYRVNLTHSEQSQMLTAPLSKEAGGLGLCREKDGGPVFGDTTDGDYQAMLKALRNGVRMLELNPRVDMFPRPDPANPEAYAPSLVRARVMP